MTENDVLLEEVGPNGNVQAVVESNGSVCFFYLFFAPETELGVRSVWMRNLERAPASLDRERMRAGEPPLNPRPHCRHPDGCEAPEPERLRVVWLPEGNGAALLEDDDVLAILPPWSGSGGFHGYARDAIGDGPLAWELAPDNAMFPRIAAAENYWRSWADETLWSTVQTELLSRIEGAWGRHFNYYAIDGGNWPPRALVRIPRRGGGVILATLGLSLRPQPDVEMYTEDPASLRRIELAAVLPPTWPDDSITRFAGYLSGQSDLPWERYTWLGPGHTIPCDSWRNEAFRAALLTSSHGAVPSPDLGTRFGDPVRFLWFLPITNAERERAMATSSAELSASLPATRWEEA